MKQPAKGKHGLTLIELFIVLAIITFITAVVVPNVIGFLRKGGIESYEADREIVQLATYTFYYDVHDSVVNDPNQDGDYSDTRWGCDCAGLSGPASTPSHSNSNYYPTSIAIASDHVLQRSRIKDSFNKDYPAYMLVGSGGVDGIATDADISQHAIWMGLLVNEPGSHVSYDADGFCDGPSSECGTTSRSECSSRIGENGLYLQETPVSAMATDSFNGARTPGSTYCWIVGKRGTVYGAYKGPDGNWYAGFNGNYP